MLRKPGDIRLAAKLRKAGIDFPLTTIWESRRVGLDLASACALLEKESAGGANVFGHDPTIFAGAGRVTKKKYLQYRALRHQTGKVQGVGPCQLTFGGFQDAADHMGGCWRPSCNMREGFSILRANIHVNGLQEGAARFNGTGPAAEAYGRDFIAKRRVWVRRLA